MFAADVESELLARIAPYQPLLASRLAQRLAVLPDAELSYILSSEAALIRAIDSAVAQELGAQPQPKIFRCLESPMVHDQGATAAVLANRVTPLEPENACKITEKILNRGTDVVNECMASDFLLKQHVDAAVASILQEETSVKSRVLGSPLRALSPMPSSRVLSPMPSVAAPVRAVSPMPSYRSIRAVSPDVRAAVMSPPVTSVLSPVVTSPIVASPTTVVSRRPLGQLPGLDDFLFELGLSAYCVRASEWVATMGAMSLNEVLENQQDFADALGLRPLERSRLLRDGPVVAARLVRLQPLLG